jgi:hypothetical protein
MMKENHTEAETKTGEGLSVYMYAFLGGAALGAVTALLLAPQSEPSIS